MAAKEEDFEAVDGIAGMIEGNARERVAQVDVRGRIKQAIAGLDRKREAASGAIVA